MSKTQPARISKNDFKKYDDKIKCNHYGGSNLNFDMDGRKNDGKTYGTNYGQMYSNNYCTKMLCKYSTSPAFFAVNAVI